MSATTLFRSFQQRGHEGFVLCRGESQHGKTVHERRKWLALFVGRNVRRDKINSVQFVMVQRRLRQGEMSAMNRVEGPAKESCVHGVWSVPPSVQIPALGCKLNRAGIGQLAIFFIDLRASPGLGHSRTSR